MITATKRRGGCFHFRLTTSCPSKAGTEAADLDASHCAKTGGRSARSSRRTHEKKQKKKKGAKEIGRLLRLWWVSKRPRPELPGAVL